MTTEHMIILELVTVLVMVTMISLVLWRDKARVIAELSEVNDALIEQIEALESHSTEHKMAYLSASKGFESVEADIEDHLKQVLSSHEEDWSDMEALLEEQDKVVSSLREGADQWANKNILKELDTLTKLLEESKKKVASQKIEIASHNVKTKEMKVKIRELTKKALSIEGLEIRERRLVRDKKRIVAKFNEIKDKYEGQRAITRNLEKELKTSFRAEEVKAMRGELKENEDALKRALAEKNFIEQHFLELDENSDEEALLLSRLDRAKREIEMLEKTVLDMDKESKE
jgi:hypothetical protein